MTDSEYDNGKMDETRSSGNDVSSLSGDRRGCKRRLEGTVASEQQKPATEESKMRLSLQEEKMEGSSGGTAADQTTGITMNDIDVATDLPDGMTI